MKKILSSVVVLLLVAAPAAADPDLQALEQARLDRAQNDKKNACENHPGQSPFGNTYTWAVMPDQMPPYHGLETAQPQTAELWNAFCQVRVTLHSDDEFIRQFPELAVRYFELGEHFICGGWMTHEHMEKIEGLIKERGGNVEEWFHTIGPRIQCMIGTRTVGTYGDMIYLQ